MGVWGFVLFGIVGTHVDNVCVLLADGLVVPLPDLGGNGLTDRAKDSERLHLVLDVLVASALQKSERGRSDVELCDIVLRADLPVSAEIRVCGSALEDDSGDAEDERSVDDVGVAGDPAHVATAEEDVGVVDVEDVLAGHGGAQKVAGGRVHDTLGLAGGARGVEQEERVLGVHGLGRVVGGPLLGLLVPPQIATLSERHIGASALVDQAVLDVRALLESIVDNLLGANGLAAALALVGGDDNLGLGVNDAIAQRVGAEAREDHGVDSADARAGQERDDGFGNHGHVQSDRVALLHAHLLEHPRELGHLRHELAVGDCATTLLLIGLVDDGRLVGVFEGVAVHAVV